MSDKSTDSSAETVQKFCETHANIQFISQPSNLKQGAARNLGMRHATGDYISDSRLNRTPA